jgi:hypothetical protein
MSPDAHDRDEWNAQAILIALQPWELDVVERGLTCLAALAGTHPDWEHVRGQETPALSVIDKLNQVLRHQGYAGGIDGLRGLMGHGGPEPEPAA